MVEDESRICAGLLLQPEAKFLAEGILDAHSGNRVRRSRSALLCRRNGCGILRSKLAYAHV